MKNKLFYALLVTMFTACTLPEGVNDNGNTLPSRPDYIFCSFEEDTRVELNKKMKTVWSEGDQVICFSTGILDTWNYVGQTGEQDGTFESLDKLSPSDDYNYGGLYYTHTLAMQASPIHQMVHHHHYTLSNLYRTTSPTHTIPRATLCSARAKMARSSSSATLWAI